MTIQMVRKPEEVGHAIREMRKARMLTLRAVAAATGLSLSGLSDIERGTCQPSIDSLFAICRCLKLALWLDCDGPGDNHC